MLAFLLPITFHPAQAQLTLSIDVPTKFKLDREIATRLRPTLLRESEEASGSFTTGIQVLRRLTQQTSAASKSTAFSWELRVTKQPGDLNAFSSPDGTVYVDRSLANLLGTRPGLWAAALSHEIAHILHQDWARRYLYEKSMRNDSTPALSLGESNTLGAWTDPASLLSQASRFSRLLETNADSDGLMLMARAGYHPDFMFSLHKLLRARAVETAHSTVDALHPEWTSREQALRTVYASAGHEYERLWPEMSDSPGGIPPVVVSTGEPVTRKRDVSGEAVLIPLRCSNLSGAVEVVLRLRDKNTSARLVGDIDPPPEWRQFTSCTSDVAQIKFRIATDALLAHGRASAGIYIIVDRGSLIAASDAFRLRP